jgi:hypothetical protein
LQVLYAHIFGVTLLNEQETVWGILGSLLIASGVVTVNVAKGHKSSATSEHPSLLPMFQYMPTSTSERNAAEDLHEVGKAAPAAPDGLAENDAEEAPVAKAGAQGSRSFLQTMLARLKDMRVSARRSSCQREVSSQQVELSEAPSSTPAESGRAFAAETGAASITWEGGFVGEPMAGPTPYTCVPQQDNSGQSGSAAGAGKGAEVSSERRRVRGAHGEYPRGVGSLRDGEKSWVGEWAFRQEVDGGSLAPAMARYHQLLEKSRQ